MLSCAAVVGVVVDVELNAFNDSKIKDTSDRDKSISTALPTQQDISVVG